MIDPYIYSNGTLRNKLGIEDYDELKNAEKDIGFVKLINIGDVKTGNFDKQYLQNIHKHIFEDIFEWAGDFRTVPLTKIEVVIPGLSLIYAAPKDISKQLDGVLDQLNNIEWKDKSIDEIVPAFLKQIVKIWKIHPFRDGNTRATLAFADRFAKEHGFQMDMEYLLHNLTRVKDEAGKITRYSIRDKFVLASLDEENYPEPEHLERLIKQAIQVQAKKEKNPLKGNEEQML